MTTKVRQATERRSSLPASPSCRHHWIIETPNGPTADGVCKLCGQRRLFRTYSDDYIRDDVTISAAA